MRRTLYFLPAALFLLPPTLMAAQQDPIYLQEIKIRTAIHAHDLATVESLLAPGFLEVEDTISTRDQVLGFLKSCTVNSFAIHSHQTRMLTPDIAIIVYPVQTDVTCGSDKVSGEFNDSTTWVRHSGKWQAVLHTNAVAAKP
ncbi:MAG TPA: nuclear transport factor 2 family protein [Steroidobacteraceae bacterium]|jgi:hypothetical protein